MTYVEMKLKKRDSNPQPLNSYKNPETFSHRGLYNWMGKDEVIKII